MLCLSSSIVRAEDINLINIAEYGSKCSGLPSELILSIILHESRGNPYALNIQGQSYYPESYHHAVKLIYYYNNALVDIGLMQINYYWWGPVLKLRPEELLNPYINVCAGALILKDYIDRYGYMGIGRYHSGKYKKQIEYIKQIKNIYSIVKGVLD